VEWVEASGRGTVHSFTPSLTTFGSKQSGEAAYAMAGLGPEEVDFARLYDCFTIVPIIEMEELGLAERGAGGEMFLRGETAIEGRLPINTDGGLLSHAQAGAGGGIFGIVEATRQLRGDQGDRQVARHDVALGHNEGGILSSNCTMLLGRERR
jgi:acetyl-CoA acetyltransferase